MGKNKTIFIVIILAILIILVWAFYPKGIKCSDEGACLEKYFESCKYYKDVSIRSAAALVNFEGTASVSYEVLGEKRDGKCGISFTVDSVTSEEDSWATGKSATCYSTVERFRYANPLEVLEEDCMGTFVTEALARCYESGASTDSRGNVKINARCSNNN